MAISRTLLKALAFKNHSPHQCLNDVNYLLSQDNPKSMFVTLFYGVLNLETGELEYSNGGHNSPSVITNDSDLIMLKNCNGCALGVNQDYEYQSEKTVLTPGDSLILYTDGIPEAININENVFSENRLREFIKQSSLLSPDQIIHGLISEVNSFVGNAAQSDDITTMAIKFNQ
jgi:sigma-B regulation protein RsbU (phosphoserine phosphatase)